MSEIIVVGGGLSGLSAAHTILERGGRVLLLDKNSFIGGNSTKATSGINGALTSTQISKGIPDSKETFYEDTKRSARDLVRPELVKVLTYNSASAVEWLKEKFKLDLSLVAQLGGHSFPRTHRGESGQFPGMAITYALMETFTDICEKEPHRARLLTKARVTEIIKDSSGTVIGVKYDLDGTPQEAHGPVILATGGYAADFSSDSLLKKYRPDIYNLSTTNLLTTEGDGHKMGIAIGANAIDMEKVQVHPTGLVDPKEPKAKTKFLAAEALRGVGGLILDANGKRICDELGHRDYVTGEMWKNKGPFRLVLNSAASKQIEWHCKHYKGRGLMKLLRGGSSLANEMGVSVSTLEKTFNDYNEAARTKKDPFGKKFFHAMPWKAEDEFYVAIITPVLHFTMGGLEISEFAEVKTKGGPIPGLFAAGEICGGVHGANRLGGSSLLGCVVYGRVAGASASSYQLTNYVQGQLSSANGDAAPVTINVDPSSHSVRIEVKLGKGATTAGPSYPVKPKPSADQGKAVPAKPSRELKTFSLQDVAKHNTEKDCWVVVNGQVLDVTNFLNDHPGGPKAILQFAGRDATEEFNMLHKPDVVQKYAPDTIIGTIVGKAKL